jgi:putative NADH-flavin reductase
MNIIVVGASGATGKLVVQDLIKREHIVKAVVRAKSSLPSEITSNKNVSIITGSILEFNDLEMEKLIEDCDAVISCLGHNLTFKGMYGQPRKLVTQTIEKIYSVIKNKIPNKKTKFVLMNSSGNSNRDLNEIISLSQKCVMFLIRTLVPPHLDNEQASDYLRVIIGQNNRNLEWVAVRPDALVNKEKISEYEIFSSPQRSAIFNAGDSSRINVAHFMSELVSNEKVWNKWKGQMPIIYNRHKEQ